MACARYKNIFVIDQLFDSEERIDLFLRLGTNCQIVGARRHVLQDLRTLVFDNLNPGRRLPRRKGRHRTRNDEARFRRCRTDVNNVAAGRVTGCAVPLPVDPNNPQDMMALRAKMSELPMKCVSFDVAANASVKQTIEVPAAWLGVEK